MSNENRGVMQVTRFWGRDQDCLFARIPKGTLYYKEENGAVAVQLSISDVEQMIGDREAVVSAEGNDLYMTTAHVILRHPQKGHIGYAHEFGVGYPEEAVLYTYNEGNYACDCNRALLLRQYCGVDVDAIVCGHTIELLSLEIEHQPVEWEIKV